MINSSDRARRWGGGRHRAVRLLSVTLMSLAMMIGLNSPAMAGGRFTNHQTTMIIHDSGRYVGTVEIEIWTGNQMRSNVHPRVWGSGFSGWTHTERSVGAWITFRGWVRVNRVLPEGSRVCAEGFFNEGSHGLPCVTITA
jgi:hypothetical protein